MARYQASMRMGALNLLVLVIALCLTVLSVLALVTAHANAALSDKQAESATENYAEDMAGEYFLASFDKRLAPSKAAGTVAEGLNSSLRLMLPDMADEACARAMESYPEVELSANAELLNAKSLYSEMKVSYSLRNNLDDEELFQGLSASPLQDDGSGEEILDEGISGAPVNGAASEEVIIDDSPTGAKDEIISEDVDLIVSEPDSLSVANDAEFYYALASVLEECVGGVKLEIMSTNGHILDTVIGIKSDGNYVVLSWMSSKEWYAEQNKETLWMG